MGRDPEKVENHCSNMYYDYYGVYLLCTGVTAVLSRALSCSNKLPGITVRNVKRRTILIQLYWDSSSRFIRRARIKRITPRVRTELAIVYRCSAAPNE
jgi:hypothetical protein